MSVPKVQVQGVCKRFGRGGATGAGVQALENVSLSVMPGEFVCLLGPSGCGKTTLLRMMNGLITPDSGRVLIDGVGPPVPGPQAGFVFQSFRLLPWRTIMGNVEFPLELQGMSKTERQARAREYLTLVGLESFEHSFPNQLSGGMQQRVGLARALSMHPEILLMDEPFAALDAHTREFMQIELSRIWEEKRVAVVFVTHSLDEALFLADRIILLRPRPGAVDQELEVALPRPRWGYDFRAEPVYLDMRNLLWDKMRQMVADQPEFARWAQPAGVS